MTFYIPEFWCGVLATVLSEFCVAVGAAVVSEKKDKKKKDKKKKGEGDVKEKADGLVGTYDDHGQWHDSESTRN